MIDDWDFYFLHIDDEPASIFLNLGLAQDAPLESKPYMAYVRILMRQPRPDGLSSQEEYDALIDVEDVLTERLAARGDIYAGRNTSGGNRDFYYYTADPDGFTETASAAVALHRQYEFEIGGRLDADWEVYRSFLYPSPVSLQSIFNRRVIKNLEAHGDKLSSSRVIDHVAYLPTASGTRSLRDFLTDAGFEVGEPEIGNGALILSFKRQDRPDQIDKVVLPIVRRIQELGGEYDGWGCEVVS